MCRFFGVARVAVFRVDRADVGVFVMVIVIKSHIHTHTHKRAACVNHHQFGVNRGKTCARILHAYASDDRGCIRKRARAAFSAL